MDGPRPLRVFGQGSYTESALIARLRVIRTKKLECPQSSASYEVICLTVLPVPTSAVVEPPAKVSPAKALEIYQGDANFMTSLARGLTVLETFTQQTPQ